MSKLTIQDISKVLIERNGLGKKEASAFANAMFDVIQQALERDKIVKVKGFGTFKIIDVEDRESVNVNTGERVLIEGHNKITFVPDALMKELVNKPFSQFETVVLKDGVDFDDMEGKEENDATSVPLVEFGDSINLKPVILGGPETLSEPQPETVSEPVAETELVEAASVEAASVEAEPVEPEPVSEAAVSEPNEEPANETVEEPAEEPVEKPVEDTVEDPVGEEENEAPVYEWEEESSSNKTWWIALGTSLLGLIAGYLLGSYFPLSRFTSQNDIVLVYPDSIKEAVTAPELVDSLEEVVDPTTAIVAPAEPAAPSKVISEEPQYEVDPTKYDAMDVRVRTGAYKIIGTDHIVKVKEGETLGKISRRVLGPDMECYLEVYNGLKASSELKVGQEIKVPKLKLKKKKMPQTVNE